MPPPEITRDEALNRLWEIAAEVMLSQLDGQGPEEDPGQEVTAPLAEGERRRGA